MEALEHEVALRMDAAVAARTVLGDEGDDAILERIAHRESRQEEETDVHGVHLRTRAPHSARSSQKLGQDFATQPGSATRTPSTTRPRRAKAKAMR